MLANVFVQNEPTLLANFMHPEMLAQFAPTFSALDARDVGTNQCC